LLYHLEIETYCFFAYTTVTIVFLFSFINILSQMRSTQRAKKVAIHVQHFAEVAA